MPSIKRLRRSAIEKGREIAVLMARRRLGHRDDLTQQEKADLANEVEQIIDQWYASVEAESASLMPKDRLGQLLREYLELCEQLASAEAEHDLLIMLLEDAMSLAADLEEGATVSSIERALNEAGAQRTRH
jgi:hypothetical protein